MQGTKHAQCCLVSEDETPSLLLQVRWAKKIRGLVEIGRSNDEDDGRATETVGPDRNGSAHGHRSPWKKERREVEGRRRRLPWVQGRQRGQRQEVNGTADGLGQQGSGWGGGKDEVAGEEARKTMDMPYPCPIFC